MLICYSESIDYELHIQECTFEIVINNHMHLNRGLYKNQVIRENVKLSVEDSK